MSFLLKFVQNNSHTFCNGSSILLNSNRYFASRASQIKSIKERLGIPDKPKRPLSTFFRFLTDIAPTIATGNRNAKKLSQEVSILWKKIDEDKKRIYTEAYNNEMVAYKDQIEVYKTKIRTDQWSQFKDEVKAIDDRKAILQERKKLKNTLNELGKPKRILGPYFLFCTDVRKKSPSIISNQETKAKWDALSDADKKSYVDKSSRLHEQYKTDLSIWEGKMIKAGRIDLVRDKVRKEFNRKQNKPK